LWKFLSWPVNSSCLSWAPLPLTGLTYGANASKDKNVTYERAEQLARREHLRQKIQQAKGAIEAREKVKAVEGQAAYLKKKAAPNEL